SDLIERIHLLLRLFVATRDLAARLLERVPCAVAARERERGGIADMPHAERIDEAIKWNVAPRSDRIEQVPHRRLAVALFLFEPDFRLARLEREDLARLLDPAALVEQLDLLLAESFDVKGAPRGEMPEVLDPLMGARELAGTAETYALLACRV